ncbi:aspartate--tRNA ligase dps1 [Coemansia sp. Cherry 401B]|nr:aspartate--tRNA ligase dps1 [Coemansia sp. RSA 2704]KAJ2728249.1 aspartate--tRNA ligase dps1 [Coemansia sp. Cherry 401B]
MAEQEPKSTAKVDELAQKVAEVVLGEDGQPLSKKALKKLEKEREKEQRKQERLAREAAERAAREAAEVDYAKDKYGRAPVNMSREQTQTKWTALGDLTADMEGRLVNVQARVQDSRAQGNKLCFLVLREAMETAQAVVMVTKDTVSKQMAKFAASISAESIVTLTAVVVKPEVPVESCTVGNVELRVETLFVTSEVKVPLPFSLEDAMHSEQDYEKDPTLNRVGLDTRLNSRSVDLRTITNNAIFKIQAAVCQLFREYLINQGATEIHTPKIISTASEGGSNVFQITYFKGAAFLAQSPQLYKQACIAADFGKVFEIAPVFRAEDSNTLRHLTEYVGLDLEFAFREHYHEVMYTIGDMFVYIFKNLEARWARELAIVRRQYPSEPIKFDEKPLRLEYPEAIALLRANGEEIGDFDDMSTPQEKLLGKLVKQKYDTDFYMLDKFPLAVRPFYTMPDPTDANYSNSYDFFLRGQEIMSGAQRVHDADLLKERVAAHGIPLESLDHYIKAFEYGCPPHAGGGVGLERVVMFYLGINNIRMTSLFPRDPKRVDP